MKVSIYFNQSKTTASGMIPILLCVSRPKRFYISTGLSSSVVFSDGIFPKSEKNHKTKTVYLNRIIEGVEEIVIANPLMPTAELKTLIKKKVFGKEEHTKTLSDYIQEFANTKTSKRTHEIYAMTAKDVRRYDKNATLEVDFRWLENYEQDLRKRMKVNSLSIHLRNIRAVINWAAKNDLTENNPFRKYRIPSEAAHPRPLSVDEIAYIRDAELPKFVSDCRDVFMLMFYLIGINGVDLLTARKYQVVNGRLNYIRSKTKRPYSILIPDVAQEIIDRHSGKEYLLGFAEGKDYKKMLDKIDRNIKRIRDGLTTYQARYSWATIAYNIGVPKDTISHALGHSMGNPVTSIYIEPSIKEVDDANEKVISMLPKPNKS